VERNIKEDYVRAFGDGPVPAVLAIGVMTDSDNSAGEALAYYDEIRVTEGPILGAATSGSSR
jgi:hypothetical protein